MHQTIATVQARGAFDRGFLDGHDDARRDMTRDLAILLEKSPHYACGYSRGIVAFAAGDSWHQVERAWSSYVEWLHETRSPLAADLIELEELEEQAPCA